MIEEEKTPDKKTDTSNEKDLEDQSSDSPSLGNALGNKARNAIYEKFDANDDSPIPGDKGKSDPDKDSKQKSDSDTNPDKVESDDAEKPTSGSKGKDKSKDDGGSKTVPLQALQESRERFKKLNLEYRQTKDVQDKEIQGLKEQINKLNQFLKNSKENSAEDSFSEEDNEKKLLRQQLEEYQAKSKSTEERKKQEAALKLQQEYQSKVDKVTKELTEEGYPGFDYAIVKTGQTLRKMLLDGEITPTEENDPKMWKKVFKEHVYEGLASTFTKQSKEDIMKSKKSAKKRANLIQDPGTPEEEPTKDDEDDNISYEDFVKSQMKTIQAEQRKKLRK